jgi:uncharacterized membrane protein
MKAIAKRLKSKTYWAAIFGTALVVLEQNGGVISGYLPAEYRSLAVLVWPVLMIALREVTTKPVADK